MWSPSTAVFELKLCAYFNLTSVPSFNTSFWRAPRSRAATEQMQKG